MAEVFNKIVKSMTEPTDTRCLWIKGNDLYVYINGEWKNWYLSGIQIQGKTAKDLLGCDSNFLYLGATDDTTSYANIAPLNEEGKVPTTYIDKLDSTVQVVYNDTKYEMNMDKAIELGLFSKSYEFVDLGLPSGTLWMKCNIGAEKETDYGLYFQWGDTVGYDESTAAAHSTWSTCPGNGGASSYDKSALTTWDTANLTDYTLNTNVDAAYAHTNGKAKMPTKAQYQELINETNNEWITIDGVVGRKFTNKTDSSKYIFIPAAGNFGGDHFGEKSWAIVWARTLRNLNFRWSIDALYIKNSKAECDEKERCIAGSIRGVLNQ